MRPGEFSHLVFEDSVIPDLKAFLGWLNHPSWWQSVQIEPDDVVQDTIARLLHAQADVKCGSTEELCRYARTVSKRLLVDRIRKHQRERSCIEKLQAPTRSHASNMPDVSGLDRAERRLLVWQLLTMLHEDERELLEMFFFQYKSTAELSTKTGLSERTCQRKIRALISKLRAVALSNDSRCVRVLVHYLRSEEI